MLDPDLKRYPVQLDTLRWNVREFVVPSTAPGCRSWFAGGDRPSEWPLGRFDVTGRATFEGESDP